jgi:hypothetical protein
MGIAGISYIKQPLTLFHQTPFPDGENNLPKMKTRGNA